MDIKKVLKDHGLWARGDGGKRADLRGADLRGADLRDAYLRDAYLRDAYLSGADLRGADLSGADLSDTDLRGANLSGADLSGADLRGADLSGADLSGADLRGADLRDADMRDTDLRGADLRGADLRDADLRGADLRGADLRGISIPVIEDIHNRVLAAASKPGALDMSHWHSNCGTTHCRAGWVVTLAGEEGEKLEKAFGTGAAAALIYAKSDPKMSKTPNWLASNADAMADMRRLAGVDQ